jgi:alpha-L-fucosidase
MNRYLDYMKGQITELLTQYGPVSVIWFDGQDIQNAKLGRVQEMLSAMRKLQPELIINDRIGGNGTHLGDYGVEEQKIPGRSSSRPWETCMTSNNSWGYTGDSGWKDPAEVIHALVDTTSKGGNLLFNIGPDGTGAVPPGCLTQMHTVGEWMRVNEASIRDCGPCGLPEPEWGRITKTGDRLYLHVFEWPGDGVLLVPQLKKPVKRAYLLADERRQALRWSSAVQGTHINLPRTAPDHRDSVVVLEL